MSCVPFPLLPLPLKVVFCLLENVAVVKAHKKRPRVSFLWVFGQFFNSSAGLCPLARIITLLVGVTAFLAGLGSSD